MATHSNQPLRILIVEDEVLLVMDLQSMLEDLGHVVVGEAASYFEVQALSDDLQPDLAFVDVQLAKGTSGLDVCRLIRERWPRTLIVFVTSNPGKIPSDYVGGHGVIPKPFSKNGIFSAMHYLEEGLYDPPPVSPRPASFIAAPALAEAWAA